ncbi:glycosyltransferase family 2 protein [Ovoidimarina sediminis]|uniref:glycosyltransferase family 2 protein n=1 Tax=Ovoidimarina sediminis TaxID=3079856 RepID=UPI002908E91F|nr:glycosyltransferase family 2 protein [Rhodophyticola sp. MJ-SS7]MDU8945531.1 glycosyltransferase family 2 protein [Rhodophyticola sp. MJ-SS7]
MTSAPDIDVVITCYNEGAFIGDAVESVLAQTVSHRVSSITIADDGSNDETIAALNRINGTDPRIQILFGPGGGGISKQRNLALATGSAPFVAILDGDDIWTDEKLEKQLPSIENENGIGLVFSEYYMFPTNNRESLYHVHIPNFTNSNDLARRYFLDSPTILPSASLMRRSSLEAIGFFDEKVQVFEDTDFFFRLARVCRFAFIGEPLTLKRVHPDSITESRRDLLSHHAFVAFRAGALEPSLLKYIPKRLSERARKLASRAFIADDVRLAKLLLGAATRLSPLNHRAWIQLLVVILAPELGHWYLKRYRSDQFQLFRSNAGRPDA